jgi:drug/metabolite transporter (DMT)-like permease
MPNDVAAQTDQTTQTLIATRRSPRGQPARRGGFGLLSHAIGSQVSRSVAAIAPHAVSSTELLQTAGSRRAALDGVVAGLADSARQPRHAAWLAVVSPNNRYLLAGIALAIVGVVGFSLRPVLIKMAYAIDPDPITLLALRMAFALPFFILIGMYDGRRAMRAPISRADLAATTALGALGYYAASSLDFVGLLYIPANVGRLLLFLYPTIVVILSAIWLRTRIAPRDVLALLLSYAGIALVLLQEAATATLADFEKGVALVFASGVLFAIYLVGGGQLVARLGAARFTSYAMIAAAICCIVQFALLRPISGLAETPLRVLAIAFIMALVSTVVPVIVTAEALRRIGANQVAMIGSLGPVIAMFVAYLALNEAMTAIQLSGALLVILGIALATTKVAKRARQET